MKTSTQVLHCSKIFTYRSKLSQEYSSKNIQHVADNEKNEQRMQREAMILILHDSTTEGQEVMKKKRKSFNQYHRAESGRL